jgi:predicted glycosyltransferase
LIQRNYNHLKIALREKPDMYISTSAEFAPLCRLLGIAAVSVFEDDLILFPKYSNFLVPFLNYQICPISCNAAKWNNHQKTIKYNAYQELAYLRPSHFTPDVEKIKNIFDLNQKNFFIRFAKLNAWHDEKKTGITDELAGRIISLLEKHGKVHISSERDLPPQFEKYRVKIKASNILHVLYYADLYIGDSQTMTAEAAVLGTPALRFNDFVGKLGYLEELEHKYDLTYGIPTDKPEQLYNKITELMIHDNLKEEWKLKREKMLSQTIDTTKFLVWFFENYPQSADTMKSSPNYQNNFR